VSKTRAATLASFVLPVKVVGRKVRKKKGEVFQTPAYSLPLPSKEGGEKKKKKGRASAVH